MEMNLYKYKIIQKYILNFNFYIKKIENIGKISRKKNDKKENIL